MNLLITADLVETDSEYNINADFPGVENLDISMQDIYLTMKAERR
jgi:HSP20 family molecular chaperone IbpA